MGGVPPFPPPPEGFPACPGILLLSTVALLMPGKASFGHRRGMLGSRFYAPSLVMANVAAGHLPDLLMSLYSSNASVRCGRCL